ncbi:hypothetical protein FRC10_006931, partial [Ceratobasidium sp. 414]
MTTLARKFIWNVTGFAVVDSDCQDAISPSPSGLRRVSCLCFVAIRCSNILIHSYCRIWLRPALFGSLGQGPARCPSYHRRYLWCYWHCAVFLVIAEPATDVEAKIKALLGCGTKAELSVAIDALVALFKIYANDLLKIGAVVSIAAGAKASIVACICSINTSLFAKINISLKLLLVNLNMCVGGILTPVTEAYVLALPPASCVGYYWRSWSDPSQYRMFSASGWVSK